MEFMKKLKLSDNQKRSLPKAIADGGLILKQLSGIHSLTAFEIEGICSVAATRKAPQLAPRGFVAFA
jgi:hypothetical protein